MRGVGSALARASRWNRDADYFEHTAGNVSLMVQIESRAGLDALEEILAVEGVDGVFLGPADLAASLGHLGHPDHPDVVAAVEHSITLITASGRSAGVNAYAEPAHRYRTAADES
jgi:4-hydroxy-2-oxoheptanedioate aldolase